MARKSKQAGGQMPLTHYERTKKFASSAYGTTKARIAGHGQYQIGLCGLSLTRIKNDNTTETAAAATTTTAATTMAGSSGIVRSKAIGDGKEKSRALCSPSGYMYSEQAIVEYLLTKTQELKAQRVAYERQESAERLKAQELEDKKRIGDFEDSQRVVKKKQKIATASDMHETAKKDLKRTSYWLAESQPAQIQAKVDRPLDRPLSPHSQQPLRRKDLWPVQLEWDETDGKNLVCAVSGKVIKTQEAIAYWTTRERSSEPGTIVLASVHEQIIKLDRMRCPLTGQKIRQTRALQRGGSSFAASGQAVEVQNYKPTIT